MKRLSDIVSEARVKGFRDQEIKEIERVWVEACVKYEQVKPAPLTPGIAGAIAYIDEKMLVAYAAAHQYMTRTIDEWQKK